jgi:hypothetical protein
VLLVRLDGYTDSVSNVTVERGDRRIVTVKLSPAPAASPTGEIAVSSTPGNATVTLDGTRVGITPGSGEPLVLKAVPGHHSLTISLPGFASVSKDVNVSTALGTSISVVLVPVSQPTAGVTPLPTKGGGEMALTGMAGLAAGAILLHLGKRIG